MSKFIETNKLQAEIKELLKTAENEEKEAFAKLDAEGHLVAVTKTAICTKVVGIINLLQQEQLEADLEKLVNEEFASRSRATERGLEVAYNRAELSRFIKRIALVFITKKEVQQEQPSLPSNLDEAARRYVTPPNALGIRTFKAGAEWMAEQLKNMKAKKGGIK